jgi:hypothetical protein
MFVMIVSATIVLLAITAVTAHNRTVNTPLYMVRMEQVSSRMNFLPTSANEFAYTAEKGYTLNHDGIHGVGGAHVLEPYTEPPQCETWETCEETCETCWSTCDDTCPNTCSVTCRNTCPATCPATCEETCDDPTCSQTCPVTCEDTCDGPTCPSTCDDPTCYVTSCGEYTCEGPKCEP